MIPAPPPPSTSEAGGRGVASQGFSTAVPALLPYRLGRVQLTDPRKATSPPSLPVWGWEAGEGQCQQLYTPLGTAAALVGARGAPSLCAEVP